MWNVNSPSLVWRVIVVVALLLSCWVGFAHTSRAHHDRPRRAGDIYFRNRFDDAVSSPSSSLRRPRRPARQWSGDEDQGEVECAMRWVAFDMAMKISPITREYHSMDVLRALQLNENSDSKISCGRPHSSSSNTGPHNSTYSILLSDTLEGAQSRQQQQQKRRYDRKLNHNLIRSSDDDNSSVGTIYLDCAGGNDTNDGNTVQSALRTPLVAQKAARALLSSDDCPSRIQKAEVRILGGATCYFASTLVIRPQDSNIDWNVHGNGDVVFSGGIKLTGLDWTVYKHDIYVADLPSRVNASAIDSLFALKVPSSFSTSATWNNQIRLVRARYPNGNSETDQMPQGYDKFAGEVSSVDAWRIAHNVSLRYPFLQKPNTTIYPWFGHSRDTRWVLDYHTETPNSSYYASASQFWHPTIATAVRYNTTTFSPRVHNWTNVQEAVVHVIHYDWWGNWQWKVKSIHDTVIELGDGGWQDAHGGPVDHNYFFIENILEELDQPGEWYVDAQENKIYYWPIEQHQAMPPTDWTFVASQLHEIVRFQGTPQSPVSNVTMQGITFAHTSTSFLWKKYTVPSAGDWSVLPSGAVTMEGARNISLSRCRWVQVSGNGVALHGSVRHVNIEDGDFTKIGDSAVVVVGRLPRHRPYLCDEGTMGDGCNIPESIKISRNHFGQVGVFGKQTSALFIAVSKGVKFVNNVVYHGPRAGININDGFGGGHVIQNNVIFNQVLESGDHGPINTWSRSAYLYERRDVKDGKPLRTTVPEWNHIEGNFIMLGPQMGSLYGPGLGPCGNGDPQFYCPKSPDTLYTCLDHDDGSDYYLDTRNVCVFVGMKNYLGQNKIWDSNLIVYPEGAASQNRSGMPCLWTSMELPTSKDQESFCSAKPCRTKEVFTNNTCISNYNTPLEYDMFNLTDLQLQGARNTTIPLTANNTYFLKDKVYNFEDWNLSTTKHHGIDAGSCVSSLIGADAVAFLARELLAL